MVIWYDQAMADWLYNTDVSNYISVTVNDVNLGNFPTDTYWTGVPSCGVSGNINYHLNLGTNKTQTISYEIWNEWQDISWTGSLNMLANTCHPVQITQ